MEHRKYTLVYPIRENGRGSEVLLARKVRKVGASNHAWNGWGGELHANEGVRRGCQREFFKESNLVLQTRDLIPVAVLHFQNPGFDAEVFTFLLKRFKGHLQPKKDEMRDPTWFPIDCLPSWQEFMAGDKDFLPQLLAGQKLQAWVEYKDDQMTLAKETVVEYFNGEFNF